MLGMAYLICYALGQFMAGWAGNRFGPRRVLLWGMVPEEIYEVSKITEDPGKFDGEEINVKGVVMDWDGGAMNFTLADSLDQNITILITHGGGPPEGFGNNVTIVAKGLFDSATMTIESISIQVGCPSKY